MARHHPPLFLLAALLLAANVAAAASLTVHCTGKGPLVYLIGGGPAFSTWNLGPIQQRLAQRFRTCRWDMRGVGDNSELAFDGGQPALSQWIEDMAAVLPPEPVVLWGHSWGALQVLRFAKTHPERVRGLVLNNPVDPALRSIENIEFKRFVHPYVEAHLKLEHIGTPDETRHRFRSKIASYFLDPRKGWAYSSQFSPNDANNDLNIRIWQEYRYNPLTRADMQRLADKIIRVIYCRQDVLMPESLEVYAQTVPESRQTVIDDCAHFPWVESTASFYDLLTDAFTDATSLR